MSEEMDSIIDNNIAEMVNDIDLLQNFGKKWTLSFILRYDVTN